jgi:hypothetical protein
VKAAGEEKVAERLRKPESGTVAGKVGFASGFLVRKKPRSLTEAG